MQKGVGRLYFRARSGSRGALRDHVDQGYCARRGSADGENLAQRGQRVAHGGDFGGGRTVAGAPEQDRRDRAAVRQQAGGFSRTIGHVHSLHHRAARAQREPRDDELGDVGQLHRDHVAAPDAGVMQAGGEVAHPRGQLGVARRACAIDQRRV